VLQRLARAHVPVDRPRLQHDPNALAQRAAARAGVMSQHPYLAGAARAVALEDLDRGGLSRAVGSQQAEHLAAPDADVDAAQRFELAVALAQPSHLDCRLRVDHAATAPMPPTRSYQCTPLVSVAIAICSNDARSSTFFSPFDAAESGNTRY